MSTRVDSVSANTPPPALTTKVLPLYIRMYGAALFKARIARLWSPLCMIIEVPKFLSTVDKAPPFERPGGYGPLVVQHCADRRVPRPPRRYYAAPANNASGDSRAPFFQTSHCGHTNSSDRAADGHPHRRRRNEPAIPIPSHR